jgi:hypothetical protein
MAMSRLRKRVAISTARASDDGLVALEVNGVEDASARGFNSITSPNRFDPCALTLAHEARRRTANKYLRQDSWRPVAVEKATFANTMALLGLWTVIYTGYQSMASLSW